MHYSKLTGGFYDSAIHGDNIPPDAVEITAAEHTALLEAQSSGKLIQGDVNGAPVAVNPPPPTAVQLDAAKAIELDNFRKMRDVVIGRLNGISYSSFRAGDAATVSAIDAAIQALKDMPSHPSVVAAIGADETEDALQVLYFAISAQLYQDGQYAYTAFQGLDQ